MPHVNHLTVPVEDAEEAAAFYVGWFGAAPIPAPRFPVPVAWVLLGEVQLHLVSRGAVSDAYHFGIEITSREQFEALYRRALDEGVVDRETFGHHLFRTPADAVQLYLRDPAGNVVECDYPSLLDLAPELVEAAQVWSGERTPAPARERVSLPAPGADGARR